MTLEEFIKEIFPIEGLLPWNIMTPREIIEESDNFPYDDIRMVDGVLCKVLKLNDEDVISVQELLSYSPEEISTTSDTELKELYESYMANVEVEEVDLENITALMRQMRLKKEKQQELYRKMNASDN